MGILDIGDERQPVEFARGEDTVQALMLNKVVLVKCKKFTMRQIHTYFGAFLLSIVVRRIQELLSFFVVCFKCYFTIVCMNLCSLRIKLIFMPTDYHMVKQ